MERAMGIEPTLPAWKAGVLPLNYARMFYVSSLMKNGMVGITGFEPVASWSQAKRSTKLS